jgi:hypothetical protein
VGWEQLHLLAAAGAYTRGFDLCLQMGPAAYQKSIAVTRRELAEHKTALVILGRLAVTVQVGEL